MRIVLISPNILLHKQWDKAINSKNEIVSLYSNIEIEKFDFNSMDIIIFDFDNLEDYLHLVLKSKVICLSSYLEDSIGYKLLQKGVKAYGNNYMTPLNLKNVIETVNNDLLWVYPELMSFIITNSSFKEKKDKKIDLLSAREYSVALEVSRGLSNKEIAKNLDITERTVKAHISSCFSKLALNDRVSLGILIKENQ